MKDLITIAESKRLIALEKVIEAGKQTFVEVGIALAEIREKKLYRCDFNTFEEYCREKWGWDRNYCKRLINAAAVVQSLSENVPIGTLSNESQARELAKVEPEKREEVLLKAQEKAEAEDRPVTARDIRESAKSPEPWPVTNVDDIEAATDSKGDNSPALPTEKEHAAINYFAVLQEDNTAEWLNCRPSIEQLQSLIAATEVSLAKYRAALKALRTK